MMRQWRRHNPKTNSTESGYSEHKPRINAPDPFPTPTQNNKQGERTKRQIPKCGGVGKTHMAVHGEDTVRGNESETFGLGLDELRLEVLVRQGCGREGQRGPTFISMWSYTSRSALHSRMPSIIDAWLRLRVKAVGGGSGGDARGVEGGTGCSG